jgi:hypothetical protein
MPTIGAAVNEVTKERFEGAASARCTTSSRLAASLITEFLERVQDTAAPGGRFVLPLSSDIEGRGGVKTEQVFVRLNPYYFGELGRLAKQRAWYRSTYLANLFYAHADRRPVLCDAEIDAVRQVARQLASMGRNINQIAKKLNASGDNAHFVHELDFDLVRVLLDLETVALKDLIKANIRGWGVSDDET